MIVSLLDVCKMEWLFHSVILEEKESKIITSDSGSELVGSECKEASSLVHPEEESRLVVLKPDTVLIDATAGSPLQCHVVSQEKYVSDFSVSGVILTC
jgi:hypothetical protein